MSVYLHSRHGIVAASATQFAIIGHRSITWRTPRQSKAALCMSGPKRGRGGLDVGHGPLAGEWVRRPAEYDPLLTTPQYIRWHGCAVRARAHRRKLRTVAVHLPVSRMSRAMENCPLGVTRNCPLLGWLRRE
jgi:hypothetical protein